MNGVDVWRSCLQGDVFYAVAIWPDLMRRKLWCSTLGYRDRLYIASYFWKNGMSFDNFIAMLRFCNSAYSVDDYMRIRSLWNMFDSDALDADEKRERYYTYCHNHERVHSLNCTPRLLNGVVRRIPDERERDRNRERAHEQLWGYHC